MPSFSAYRLLTVPTVGGDTGVWGGELNTTINALDTILGESVQIYSSNSGNNVTLSSSQGQAARVVINNTSSSPFQLNMPASNGCFGRYNIVNLSSVGTFALITAGSSGTGGQSCYVGAGPTIGQQDIIVDGQNAWWACVRPVAFALSMDGGAALPPSGAKPSFTVPFNMWATEWIAQTDNASASGNVVFEAFNGVYPGGANLQGSGTTPTLSGGFASGGVSGWLAGYGPAGGIGVGTGFTASLNSPANFTKCTITVSGFGL